MKKLVLSVLVTGALVATSCKKAKEAGKDALKATETVTQNVKETAEKAVESTKETVAKVVSANVAGIEIPTFENETANEFVKKYSSYATDYITAKGDVLKNDLSKRGAELATKAKEIAGSLEGENATKFSKFLNAIQTKMHEVSTAKKH